MVVDTNILLVASDRSRALHRSAIEFLRSDGRRLAVTPQIIREYLAVATRPAEANGLGMDVESATENIDELSAFMRVLDESAATTTRLLGLLAEVPSTGKQVHDANIVACALVHGATVIVTDNARHFSRFAPLLAVEELPRG